MGAGLLSFDLSDDSIGLGHLFDQIGGTGAEGTAQCGSRPTCIGNGRSCQQKQSTYESCLLANIDSNTQVGVAGAQALAQARDGSTSASGKSYTTIYIVGAIVGFVLLIALLRR